MKVYLDSCCYNRLFDDCSYSQSEQIRHISNIKYKDSIHLACAEYINADVLLTTDRKFRNNSKRIETTIRVMNPNEWLLAVLYQ